MMTTELDITSQIELEKLYNKNQLMARLRREYRIAPVIEHCEKNGIPLDFAMDLLAQAYLHRSTTVGVLVGVLCKHFEGLDDGLQKCADMILKAARANLINYDGITRKVSCRLPVSEDVQEELDRYQFPMPMIVAPKEVKNNRDTGYYTSRGSIILKNNHHEDDVCLDHINRMNSIELSINETVTSSILNGWKHIDRVLPDESIEDFQKRRKSFEKYNRTARDVLDHLTMAGNRFHITHRYDKRGRTYSQGYHVNPQGNDWNKASIEFADKELVV